MKRRTAKILDYVGLIINYLKKRRAGGIERGLDGYPFLKHPVQLWTVYWSKHMEKMNKAVGMKNRVTICGGGKRLVRPFKSQEL